MGQRGYFTYLSDGIFLTTNSILSAALGFQKESFSFQVSITLVGLVLSILWLTTSWHTANVIRQLFLLSKKDMPYGLMDIYRIKPILFRPNTVFGKLIPSLVILWWITIIALLFAK